MIWVENQSDCVHTNLSEERMRILFGKSQSFNLARSTLLAPFHSNQIKSFIDIFTSLPELKETLMRQQSSTALKDNYGINAAFSDFLNSLFDYFKESDGVDFDTESVYIKKSIEKYITNQIYDK